jgi:hypothetical protein
LKQLVTALTLGISAIALVGVTGVLGASGYSLFGEASIVSPGNASPKAVKMTSDAAPGFGGVDYEIPAGTTFADFTTLATDYKFEADDSCGGGSPRFQINVEDPNSADTGNIFVYIGPPPNYTLCPPDVWTSTGDLLEGVNPIDTSQLDLGTFYDPYGTAVIKYGDYIVTGVQLVTDAGWAFGDGEQTVFADNTNIDGRIYTYDEPGNKNECKNGGWMFGPYKNQGDCVSFFATGGRNMPAGN